MEKKIFERTFAAECERTGITELARQHGFAEKLEELMLSLSGITPDKLDLIGFDKLDVEGADIWTYRTNGDYKISLFREEYEDCGESWSLRIVDYSSRSLAGIEVRDMGELVRAMGIYIG